MREAVLGVDLAGDLVGGVLVLGVERLRAGLFDGEADDAVGRNLAADRSEKPDPIPPDRAAEIAVGVVVGIDARADARALVQLQVADVVALERWVFVILVELAVELVAAGPDHGVDLIAGDGHAGVVAGGADGKFGEGAVIEVEAGAALAFGGVDPVDHDAVLAAVSEGRVRGLVAHGGAADVQGRDGHARGKADDVPHIAAVRDIGELLLIEAALHVGAQGIDQRSFAGHDNGLFLVGGHNLDVDHVGEVEADVDAVANEDGEAGGFIGELVDPNGQRREAVGALVIGEVTDLALQRGTGGRNARSGHGRAGSIGYGAGHGAGILRELREAGGVNEEHPGCENDVAHHPLLSGSAEIRSPGEAAPQPGRAASGNCGEYITTGGQITRSA